MIIVNTLYLVEVRAMHGCLPLKHDYCHSEVFLQL